MIAMSPFVRPAAAPPAPRAGARVLLLAFVLSQAWATSLHAGGGITSLLGPGSRAAPGLGGDPFRSPLRDECGWWSEAGFSRSPVVRFESVANEPLTRRATNGAGSLSFGETSWQVLGATRLLRRPLAFSGRLTSPRWNGTLAAADGELRFAGEG